ncbi:MAG: YitT family protein [Eubacteriales bacterium]
MKLTFSKKDILHQLKNLFLVIFGTGVLALGTAVFIVPFDLVTGGISGIAIVLQKIIPLELSIDFYITALTWILFFMGLIFLGKDFAAKTLISSIFYPILFSVSYMLVSPDVLGGLFYLQGSEYHDISVLLAAVFGGVFVGAGCAITFLAGGSTGGVDVLAFLMCKVFRKLKSSVVIFIIDATIVVLGVFVINNIVLSLLGIISAFVCATVIDRVFLGNSQAYVAQIVSNKSAEISRGVIECLDRTTTIVDAVGGYSGDKKKVIIVSFSIREYSELMNIINREDPGAFLTISHAHEINGEGWTHEKT